MLRRASCILLIIASSAPGLDAPNAGRPVLDAHNCYPENGQWQNRLERALSTGFPVAIEQDLAWGLDKQTGQGRPVVSHESKTVGDEPTLREHFFDKVRPLMERALREQNRSQWPLITLHFDFKDNRPELHRAVWELLGEYEPWLTTAPKLADDQQLAAWNVGPLLVLTEDNDAQEQYFFHRLKPGERLRLFGSAHTAGLNEGSREDRAHRAATLAPEKLLTERATNYRRWWNNSWALVEEGGQERAGDWTAADQERLQALVRHAHARGLWIRFYTLDGFAANANQGWSSGYNFGSLAAAEARWKAAVAAGVNLIATDHYEQLAAVMRR